MQQSDWLPISISSSGEFRKCLKHLVKKNSKIQADVQPIIDELQAGHFTGDRVPDVGHQVYKVRIKNSSSEKGKRSGYRLIYYVQDYQTVILLTIYSKSDQPDISTTQIKRIIRELGE